MAASQIRCVSKNGKVFYRIVKTSKGGKGEMNCQYIPPYPMGGTDSETEPEVKRLAVKNLPCKSACHFTDSVPVPFGIGNCSMPGFECKYSGSVQISDDIVCNEDKDCPAYEPVPVLICKKHQEEYFDVCRACEEEQWK